MPAADEFTPVRRPAPADRPIDPLIGGRWSPRAIDPTRPVERETLLTLLEAARWAASSFNEQPWRYLVFDRTDPRGLDAARDCLAAGNAWAKRAPLLLLSTAHTRFARNDRENRHALHDVGAASACLCLQATSLGLVAHQMAGFDRELARERFHLPEDVEAVAMIAVGHPGRIAQLEERQQAAETAPRARRPVGEIAYQSDWGAALRSE